MEKSQEDDIDSYDLSKMICRLKSLVNDDLDNKFYSNLMKPDCIDVMIELLKNENTFNIEELTILVLDTLLKISESHY